jgi:predicted RNase H-like HicB family nuclease
MDTTHYDSYTDARTHLKDILDAAAQGRPVIIRRDATKTAVVDADRLRDLLAKINAARAEVAFEAGGCAVFIPGLPVAADGADLDEALTEMVEALHEYAEDWQDHLHVAPNHRDNWGLVQLIVLSDDEQLRAWLAGVAR